MGKNQRGSLADPEAAARDCLLGKNLSSCPTFRIRFAANDLFCKFLKINRSPEKVWQEKPAGSQARPGGTTELSLEPGMESDRQRRKKLV